MPRSAPSFLRKVLSVFSVPLLAATALGWSPRVVCGQASVNVSPLDPVYRDIEKLIGHGLIAKVIVGQRPYSRREIARLTGAAMVGRQKLEEKLNDPETDAKEKQKLQARLEYIDAILDRLKNDYHEELVQLGFVEGEKSWYSAHPIEKIEVGAAVTNSPPEALTQDNGLGGIHAVINPLLDYRQGRHLVDGGNLWLETTHWVRASNYFALYVQPRFQLGLGLSGQADQNRVDILNLNAKFLVKNFEVEIGRDNLFYGQGENAGLLLSNNPRGLDMVKISNDEPFFFPWVFKYMGAQKLSFFYSDLGPEQLFPHSYLVGYKWSLQPFSFWEFGASILTQGGGEGSPPASVGDRVADVLPFHNTGANQIQISNHLFGFDMRFRVPTLRQSQFYFEMILDDTTGGTLRRDFWDDTGYVFGLYLPRLTDTGKLDLRLEYHHTGVRYYRHPQMAGGWTLNQFLIGDNLGPNAYGVYGTLGWDINPWNFINFRLAYENRSSDVFMAVTEPTFQFVKVQDNPDERRVRFVSEWRYRIQKLPIEVLTQFGYERAINFNFVADRDRNNFLGWVGVQFDLDKWASFPKSVRP